MATAAARQHRKAPAQSRWRTIRLPPDIKHESLVDEGMRCIREKKLSHEEMVILYGCLNYGLKTGAIDDPDSETGLDRDKSLDVEADVFCDYLHNRLQLPRRKLVNYIDKFVELGFFRGLEPRAGE